jgi:hypothetical protein
MKVKTSELNGVALDWVVAGLEGEDVWRESRNIYVRDDDGNSVSHYSPSTYWAEGGPIIEREKIGFWAYTLDEEGNENPGWYAETFAGSVATGPTPLIAAMRCYVASELGDEVEVPEELK